MAGDVAAHICSWYSGLAAEQRNENIIEVGLADYREAIEEEEVNHLPRLWICKFNSFWPDFLPRGYRLSDNRVNRLSECSRSLVNGYVEHTNRAAGQHRRVPWNRHILFLPTDATEAQSHDFIHAESGEQPRDYECSAHLDWVSVLANATTSGKIPSAEV